MMFASGRYSETRRAAPPECESTTIVFSFIERAAVIAACAIAFVESSYR